MDIIEMIGKELDDFALQAARLYNAGFKMGGIRGAESGTYIVDEPVDRFFILGIEHGAAWRKLCVELGLIKKED